MKLVPVTDDVHQLVLPPRKFINAYLCFGHGKPLRDAAKLQAFAESLPHD
jgi:hypothetical protein